MSGNALSVPDGFRGIFVGASTPIEMLYGALNSSGKGRFFYVYSGSEALENNWGQSKVKCLTQRSRGAPLHSATLHFVLVKAQRPAAA